MNELKDKIIRNAVRCQKCGDILESKHTHDFVTCQCGNVSVDGGHSYLKRSFKEYGAWDELSEVVSEEEKEK